jgi:hypothetical protein
MFLLTKRQKCENLTTLFDCCRIINLFGAFLWSNTMARPCSASHCGSADAMLNELCPIIYRDAPGGYAGKPVPTRDANGPCICTCSCLAFDTPVEAMAGEFRSIQDFISGDEVLACGGDFSWKTHNVEFSSGSDPDGTQPDAIFVEFDGGSIIVTSDHLFLVNEGFLRRANTISTTDTFLDPSGISVKILTVKSGFYRGGFHHIATSRADPNGKMDGHLLNTNGIISADYTVQLSQDQFLAPEENDLPVVGSSAYENAHGETPDISSEVRSAMGIHDGMEFVASAMTVSNGSRMLEEFGEAHNRADQPKFVETKHVKLRVPGDACRFISDQDARAKARERMKTGSAAFASREDAGGLIYHLSRYYPNVVYHLDWHDDEVNAFAWVENGVRHVALLGGLIRHWAIEWESLALVLAHELAHHYGGTPTFPHGLSCEGQADYYGAGVVMRQVWFADHYVSVMVPAITQLQNFFSPNPGNHGCNHPSRDCRVSIYTAALDLHPIPDCAFAT